jgi:hypothetical protein
MSADRNSNIEKMVYVRLLNEGIDVWRPVSATQLSDGTYRLLEPPGYDPEVETWEFPPHSIVRCAPKRFSDGEESSVAVALIE